MEKGSRGGGKGRGGEGMHRRAHNHLKSAGSERNEKEGGGREEMCPAGAREGAPCARTAGGCDV